MLPTRRYASDASAQSQLRADDGPDVGSTRFRRREKASGPARVLVGIGHQQPALPVEDRGDVEMLAG